MFKAIKLFSDLYDGGYVYHVGDEYPRHGYEPPKSRFLALSTSSNVRGIPLITEVNEDVNTAVEEEATYVKPKKRSKKNANGDMSGIEELVRQEST